MTILKPGCSPPAGVKRTPIVPLDTVGRSHHPDPPSASHPADAQASATTRHYALFEGLQIRSEQFRVH